MEKVPWFTNSDYEDYFGKIDLAVKIYTEVFSLYMARIRDFLLFLFLCLLIFSFGHETHAAVLYSVTSTSGTVTASPSATQGTPSATNTPSEPPTSTPTSTLIPLPVITLIFPAATTTTTVTPSPNIVGIKETPNLGNSNTLLPISPRLKVAIALIILMWVFLAGFVIIYLRQLR